MPFALRTTALGGSPLGQAVRAGTTPAEWTASVPSGVAAWRERATMIAAEHPDWLEPLRPAFGEGAQLLEPLGPAGVVVTTGQQPGLFGGPIYTLAKALSALAMAQAHERATGIPTRAVFWAATDDADYAEAASIAVPGLAGAERLSLAPSAAGEGVPLACVPLGAEVEALVARLAATCGSAAAAQFVESARHFTAGTMIGAAYVAQLRALLEPLGIAVLDAAHPAVGERSRSWLASGLEQSAVVDQALRERAAAIEAAGYVLPVVVDRTLSLVFVWEGTAVAPHKRRLAVGERPAARVRLSPNVLLRPVLEAWLLPTTTYVAGPGELAYFAQVGAVAAALGRPAPLALPRWSGMLIPEEARTVLDAHGWSEDMLRDPHAAESALARARLPEEVASALGRLRSGVARDVEVLGQILPEAAVAGARSDLGRRVDRIERRALAAVKHREAVTLRAVARARGQLYPFGAAQERTLSFVPFLARYGMAYLEAKLAAARVHAATWWPEAQ
jgi:uncharacterized protein YllA (UPF0747 family)